MDALHTTLGETRRTVNQMREAHQALEDKQARTSREHGQERVQWQAQVTDLQAKLDSWSTLQQSWQTESEELKCHVAQLTAQRTHLQSAYGTVLQYHTALVSEVKSMRAATVHTLDQYCQQLVKLNATASACRIASRHLLQSHSNAHCTWEHEKLGLLTQLATIETQLTRATETYAQQRQNHADELTTAQEQLANRDRAHTTLQSKFSQQAAATARLRCTLDQAVMELGHERQLLSANIAEHQRTHRAQIDQLQLLRRILIAQAESQQAQHAESRQQYCALQQRYDKALEDKARAEQEFRIRLESMEQDCTKSVATANHTVALLRAQRATQLNLYQQSHAQWEQAVTGLRADVCNSKAQHQCEMRNFANAMAKIRQQAAQALQIVAYNYQTWTDQSLQWRDAEAHWDQRLRATEEAKATLTVELARVEASNDHALTTMRQAWQAEASQFTATRHQDHQRLETLAQSLASQKLRWQTHTTAMAAAFHQICSDLAQARAMQMSELSSFSTQYNQLQTLGRELRSNTATALTHCQDQASALAARLESTLSLSQARALTLYDNLTTQAMRIETALKHLPGTAAVATTPPRTAALSSPSTGSPRPSASVRALEKKNIALAAKFTNAQRQWQAQERQLLARLEALQTDATKLGTRLATQQSKSENATLNHALATKERELAALEAKWEHRSEIWEAEAQDLRSRVAQAESDAKATNNDRDLVDASRRPLIALKIKNAQLAAQLKVAHDKLDQFRGSVAHTAQAVSKPPTSPDSPSPSTPSSSSVLKKKALLQKARQISAQRAAKKLLGA
ncbi:hypothetical protein H4R35_006614 [Dimargaris xerosporica]|nr:hypothetical protein H4R35_006614 [Dimargaris xerosporica]